MSEGDLMGRNRKISSVYMVNKVEREKERSDKPLK